VKVSVVIPVLNDADALAPLLAGLTPLRGEGLEVIVVDGGSRDATLVLAEGADRTLESRAGRALQMNAGARAASGDVLWFLHADSVPSPSALTTIVDALRRRQWGRLDVRLSGDAWALRVIERLMNLRSRWTGIATGDQGIFVRREAFEAIGGYPDQPLMEDIELSRRLRRLGWPACPAAPLIASSRRWERDGVWRTVLLMWCLRLAYFAGAPPAALYDRYYGQSSPELGEHDRGSAD